MIITETINFHPFPILSTKRLTLRKLDLSDAEEIFELRSDKNYGEYTRIKQYTSIDEAKAYIGRIDAELKSNECIVWSIILADEDKFIGSICFWNISKDERLAEIGYDLLPVYRGKGYIQEAVEAVIQYGFSEKKLNKIFAYLRPEHLKSVKILEGNGFLKKSTHFEMTEEGDSYEMVLYGLDRRA